MPTARRSRTIPAPAERLWEVVRDPHHLPRWWPRVARVENVEQDAFTEVMMTSKGKVVRADFNLLAGAQHERSLTWVQRVQGTPFARVLTSAETEVRLEPAPGGRAGAHPDEGPGAQAGATEVTIELRQTLRGVMARLGGFMVSRAAAATIEEALDGLERISG